MYNVIPNYQVENVKLTILYSSLLTLFTFLFHYIYLNDSARNLILKNKFEEAFMQLENNKPFCSSSVNDKFNEKIRKRLINEVMRANTHIAGSPNSHMFEIFYGKFRKLTILLALVWFIDSFVTYGTGIIQSFTLKNLGQIEKYENKDIIIKQIIISITSSTGNVIGGILSEISFLGRNKTTSITFVLSATFLLIVI